MRSILKFVYRAWHTETGIELMALPASRDQRIGKRTVGIQKEKN